jgi:hypothetical protein
MPKIRDSEAHAKRYLESCGFGPVTYEPDPNHPPDLLTQDGIAVEVRRLNQHARVKDQLIALDFDALPIHKGMRSLVQTLGSASVDGSGWFVSFRLKRPATMWKVLRPLVASALNDAHLSGRAEPRRKLADGFTLMLHPYSIAREARFTYGGFVDRDAGGWFVSKIMDNAQHCSDEKTMKVAPFRHRYRRWWLLLVDDIGLGDSTLEGDALTSHPGLRHSWDRVLLLSEKDHTRALDLPRADAGL